jgi:hypothetical protein
MGVQLVRAPRQRGELTPVVFFPSCVAQPRLPSAGGLARKPPPMASYLLA